MRKAVCVLLLLSALVLPGCGVKESSGNSAGSSQTVYESDTSSEDCYLCGGGIEDLMPFCWGQDNLAIISLNTFEIQPIEINRYDRLTGQMIEEYAGTISLGGGRSTNNGFSVSVLLDYDRGYATGTLDFYDDRDLDIEKAATFLCADCLNQILPKEIKRCFGVGVINLNTKEIQMFEEQLDGFTFGDLYVDCNLNGQGRSSNQMDILIFYCPVRYPADAVEKCASN